MKESGKRETRDVDEEVESGKARNRQVTEPMRCKDSSSTGDGVARKAEQRSREEEKEKPWSGNV